MEAKSKLEKKGVFDVLPNKLAQAGLNILESCGEHHNGVLETPFRFERAMKELLSGYSDCPTKHIKVFEDVMTSSMVTVSDVRFVSLCEHHLLPFFGEAYLGYIPAKAQYKVLGVSKLVRIFQCFAKRIQVQERIGEQFVSFIEDNLQAEGVICVIKAQHFCMTARGVKSADAKMITSAIRGAFMQPEVRAEFFSLIKI